MGKLTDLEICKRIAEIEGLDIAECEGSIVNKPAAKVTMNKHYDELSNKVRTAFHVLNDYNPLTDDALCFKLMVKYKCSVSCVYKMWQCTVKTPSDTVLCYDEHPNKAICLAIIEASK